jgi:hypothetical protein
MDYSTRLDGLQQQVDAAKSTVQAAATESDDQRRKRIDQAQVAADTGAKEAQRAPAGSSSKWDQMRADAADKMSDIKARMKKRDREMDADAAATDAEFAEADAAYAIDYAAWSIDNARLAVLDAIDARANANVRAAEAAS